MSELNFICRHIVSSQGHFIWWHNDVF